MNEKKNLKIEDGVLTYYFMQHIFRNKVNATFTKEYLSSFLNGFFLNSALRGYNIIAPNGKQINTDSDEYEKFLNNTTEIIVFKYGTKVDDFTDSYCVASEFVRPLKWLYEAMSTEMSDCILEFEAALTYDAYFNDKNLMAIEDAYYNQSEKLQKHYEKINANKDDDFKYQA